MNNQPIIRAAYVNAYLLLTPGAEALNVKGWLMPLDTPGTFAIFLGVIYDPRSPSIHFSLFQLDSIEPEFPPVDLYRDERVAQYSKQTTPEYVEAVMQPPDTALYVNIPLEEYEAALQLHMRGVQVQPLPGVKDVTADPSPAQGGCVESGTVYQIEPDNSHKLRNF